MPKYLIERNVPGAHLMNAQDRHAGANRSCDVLEELGEGIEWHESYVTTDRITCVYSARDADMVREHAQRSGFPADAIHEIVSGMCPATAEPRQRAPVAR